MAGSPGIREKRTGSWETHLGFNWHLWKLGSSPPQQPWVFSGRHFEGGLARILLLSGFLEIKFIGFWHLRCRTEFGERKYPEQSIFTNTHMFLSLHIYFPSNHKNSVVLPPCLTLVIHSASKHFLNFSPKMEDSKCYVHIYLSEW